MKILIENYRKWEYILILIVKNFTHYQIYDKENTKKVLHQQKNILMIT
jgi:hypothetical protein